MQVVQGDIGRFGVILSQGSCTRQTDGDEKQTGNGRLQNIQPRWKTSCPLLVSVISWTWYNSLDYSSFNPQPPVSQRWIPQTYPPRSRTLSSFCASETMWLLDEFTKPSNTRPSLSAHSCDAIQVMTMSFHHLATGFFPGGGLCSETGVGKGGDFNVNIPLKEGASIVVLSCCCC